MARGNTDHWQERAIIKLIEDRSFLLLSIFLATVKYPLRFADHEADPVDQSGCVIDENGFAHMRTISGQELILKFQVIDENFKRLQDALKLSDTQSQELLAARRQWVVRDKRIARPSLEGN